MAFARLSFVKLKPNISMEEARKIWDGSVAPAAKDQKGFMAGFLLASEQGDEGISFGLWESKEDAVAIQKSGFYKEQIKKFAAFLAPPTERKFYDVNSEILLMKDLEATVASLTFTKVKSNVSPEEVREIWDGSVMPALKDQKGLVTLFLLVSEKLDEGISFGLWESKEDAEAIQKSCLYREQIKKFSAFIESVEGRKFYNVNSEVVFLKEIEAV